jgi:hypothetical protein
MHSHGIPLTVSAANFHSAQLEQQAEARRAAETRKRLKKASDAITSESSPEEELLISNWMGTRAETARSAPMLAGDEYRPSGRNEDPLR